MNYTRDYLEKSMGCGVYQTPILYLKKGEKIKNVQWFWNSNTKNIRRYRKDY